MLRLQSAILLISLLLGIILPGCGGRESSVRYDGRLAAVDSLLRDEPDSALAIITALPTDCLATEHDRAYRDLLLTQARYRAYVTATSDSDINRAVAYFAACRPIDREKLTRAYIYKGAVMDELGHPDSAMLYYKQAEATAAPDDYFNLGYVNMRIGKLYQKYYANDSAVVDRMKTANRFFLTLNDTDYLIITNGTLGAFANIIGIDSSRFYLRQAISLAKQVGSPKGYQYQSKLAGSYFYAGDYLTTKNLAMDIVINGAEYCNERQFYYYAARSFIHINMIDSARLIIAMIPAPMCAIDSMNLFQTMAELSKATRQYEDYGRYSEAAKRIDTKILENSRDSKLSETELKWNAGQNEVELRKKNGINLVLMIILAVLVVIILIWIYSRILRKQTIQYQKQLDSAVQEIEELLSERQKNISKQVSEIFRYRQAALNELYDGIRITTFTDEGKKRVIPLMSTLKELFENKGILNAEPKTSFWNNLESSIECEYPGLISFVKKEYPNLTTKDIHLFLLICSRFPNQIIKKCMGYSHDVTVSKNKSKLIKVKMGLSIKLEEYIERYMDQSVSQKVS